MRNDFDIAIFRKYAELTDAKLDVRVSRPGKENNGTFFGYSSNSITVFDQFPKAIFHFLVIPRVKAPPLIGSNLKSLRTLFSSNVPKEVAYRVIQEIAEDANALKATVEEEMMNMHGFKWPVYMGFHAIQSMEHIHLHVLSDDFSAKGLKKKRHYNSFNPKAGYFLHLDDVLSWFEAHPTFYDSMIRLVKYDQNHYRRFVDDDIQCHHCGREFGNKFAQLKAHLEEEWTEFQAKEKERMERRKKAAERAEAMRKKKEEAARIALAVESGHLDEVDQETDGRAGLSGAPIVVEDE